MKDEIRTLRPQYKIMRMILNQCDRLNRSKVLSTVFVGMILQTLAYFFSIAALGYTYRNGGSMYIGLIGNLMLIFISITVSGILGYGVNVTCARMVEKSYVTLGYLFSGFREKSGRVLRMSAFRALLTFILAIVVCVIVVFLIMPQFSSLNSDDIDNLPGVGLIVVLEAVYLVIVALVAIPFIFVNLVMYRRPDCGVFRSISISARLVFRQFFHFIGFMFYGCGKYLLCFVGLVIANAILRISAGESLGFISMILSCLQIVAEFRVLIRMNLALPIYFYSMTGVLQVHGSDYVPTSESKDDGLVVDGVSVSITDAPADSADSNLENQSQNQDESSL